MGIWERGVVAGSPENPVRQFPSSHTIFVRFSSYLKLDYKAYERKRQQNVLIAKLNYEQQLHIHDVNKECLNISNQRKEIVEKAIGLDIQLKVS